MFGRQFSIRSPGGTLRVLQVIESPLFPTDLRLLLGLQLPFEKRARFGGHRWRCRGRYYRGNCLDCAAARGGRAAADVRVVTVFAWCWRLFSRRRIGLGVQVFLGLCGSQRTVRTERFRWQAICRTYHILLAVHLILQLFLLELAVLVKRLFQLEQFACGRVRMNNC